MNYEAATGGRASWSRPAVSEQSGRCKAATVAKVTNGPETIAMEVPATR